ncbi:CpsD/CapB family tyrosine-protein kinase [Paenibacillus sp. NRS-1782]|uniref:CpsD/CapB family tyrosine-protein kinase n=1 Tax=unclassified Paenibacillus TaxID=185978 RepID=UPI003D2D7699
MLRLNDMLITESNPSSYVSESFRSLRTYIRQQVITQTDRGTVLLLTSPESGAGKTTLLANIGVSFAQEGRRVALVDCNLHTPALHEIFGLENTGGLTAYLRGGAASKSIVRHGVPELSIIPGGDTLYNAADLLGSERMVELLEELKREYDIILLDSAPALNYTDARLVASLTDGVILVARHARTKREDLRKTKQLMDQAGATLVGIVMNQVK